MTASERLHSAVLAAIADPALALKRATDPRWKFLGPKAEEARE